MTPLRQRLEKLVDEAKRPVAVFDLDGTAFDVTYRTMEIMHRFTKLKDIAQKFPEQTAMVAKLKYQDYLYNVEATLNSMGIDRYSEYSASFLHEAETFWFKHFFNDELVIYDIPYSGAVECAKWFLEKNVRLIYLSGRDVPNMQRGTLESLKKHGFPMPLEFNPQERPKSRGGIELYLKPRFGDDDLHFKTQAIDHIASEGDVVFTIDNEPANVKMFMERFPDGMNLRFKSLCARELTLEGKSYGAIKSFSELGFE